MCDLERGSANVRLTLGKYQGFSNIKNSVEIESGLVHFAPCRVTLFKWVAGKARWWKSYSCYRDNDSSGGRSDVFGVVQANSGKAAVRL